ncbi:hypothetical protein JOD57_001205 [Geodermatophilus bullaregiensis]|nr:hypothetical protein [Geodermatophilus bullaregiensis]
MTAEHVAEPARAGVRGAADSFGSPHAASGIRS